MLKDLSPGYTETIRNSISKFQGILRKLINNFCTEVIKRKIYTSEINHFRLKEKLQFNSKALLSVKTLACE